MAEFIDRSENRADAPPDVEGNVSTKADYTFRFTGWPTTSQLVSVAVATAVYTVLSWWGIIAVPTPVLGVSAIFIAIGFGIPFALWFGGWAFVLAYIGNVLGGALLPGTMGVVPALAFGFADIIQLGVPVILYRLFAKRFGVSPIGKDVYTVRGFIFFLLAAVLPNNILGGLYGNLVLVGFGIAPANAFLIGWFTWAISNIIVTIIIGPILLSQVGPIVERFGLTIRNLFR